MPELVKTIRTDGFSDVSRAIMTTDRVPKTVRLTYPVGKKKATLLGMAKGAGMIAPDMATMFAFLFTDADIGPELLRGALKEAVEGSFNRVRVDGDTSTNDCAFALAGGALRNTPIGAKSLSARSFVGALSDACFALAEMMARDGEGASRIMDIRVSGAKSEKDAIRIGKTIGDSPLVKTALHGADPNWGRIAAAAGRSGAKVDPARLQIIIGGIECVRGGVPTRNFDEKRAAAAMSKPTVIIEVNIGLGKGSSRFLASDFTAEYIHINAHYRT
jgi:glutamate N-acetyltransferase/amino-acid N-acetyltransferase